MSGRRSSTLLYVTEFGQPHALAGQSVSFYPTWPVSSLSSSSASKGVNSSTPDPSVGHRHAAAIAAPVTITSKVRRHEAGAKRSTDPSLTAALPQKVAQEQQVALGNKASWFILSIPPWTFNETRKPRGWMRGRLERGSVRCCSVGIASSYRTSTSAVRLAVSPARNAATRLVLIQKWLSWSRKQKHIFDIASLGNMLNPTQSNPC